MRKPFSARPVGVRPLSDQRMIVKVDDQFHLMEVTFHMVGDIRLPLSAPFDRLAEFSEFGAELLLNLRSKFFGFTRNY